MKGLRLQIGPVLVQADAISSVLATNRRIDNEAKANTEIVLELFNETKNQALELAIKDFGQVNLLKSIQHFYLVNDKARFMKLYIRAMLHYKKGKAKDLIDHASVRVWHYGSAYDLFSRIHNGDICYFHNMTYPFASADTKAMVKARQQLKTFQDLDLYFITHSSFNEATLLKMGFLNNEIRLLPRYHLNNNPYKPRDNGHVPSLIAFGRYAFHKRIPELAKLCNEAKIQFTAFGDGSSTKEYAAEFDEASKYSNKRVSILPVQKSIDQLIGEADIYICNSIHEGFNVGIIEAYANSMPVLARRGSAMDEIVDEGKTGYLYSNIDEIPHLIDKIRVNYASMARAAWQKSFYYNYDNYKKRYLAILKDYEKKVQVV